MAKLTRKQQFEQLLRKDEKILWISDYQSRFTWIHAFLLSAVAGAIAVVFTPHARFGNELESAFNFIITFVVAATILSIVAAINTAKPNPNFGLTNQRIIFLVGVAVENQINTQHIVKFQYGKKDEVNVWLQGGTMITLYDLPCYGEDSLPNLLEQIIQQRINDETDPKTTI